jgi:nucleoside-diphosphate-sugar epimerase
VLTGPSGWIGQAMLARLAVSLGGAVGARVTAFASGARVMALSSGEQLAVRDLAGITPEDVAGAHVIHLAYLTKEKAEELGERAFTDTNLAIDDALLAAMALARPASVFVASSGAAALAARGDDLHPYGLCKLRQEARFLHWAKGSGVPTIAGRIFNVAGPHINKLEAYALSNFAVQVRDTGAIRIAARLPVFRSFLHVNDLCDMVIGAARAGIGRMAPIDLCGGEVLEMADLAALVAARSGCDPQILRDSVDTARTSVYLGHFPDTRVLAMDTGVVLATTSAQVADTFDWIAALASQPQAAPH